MYASWGHAGTHVCPREGGMLAHVCRVTERLGHGPGLHCLHGGRAPDARRAGLGRALLRDALQPGPVVHVWEHGKHDHAAPGPGGHAQEGPQGAGAGSKGQGRPGLSLPVQTPAWGAPSQACHLGPSSPLPAGLTGSQTPPVPKWPQPPPPKRKLQVLRHQPCG